jgi:hypothetical protein
VQLPNANAPRLCTLCDHFRGHYVLDCGAVEYAKWAGGAGVIAVRSRQAARRLLERDRRGEGLPDAVYHDLWCLEEFPPSEVNHLVARVAEQAVTPEL